MSGPPPSFNRGYPSQALPSQPTSASASDVLLPAALAFVSFGIVSEIATPLVGAVIRLQARYDPLVRTVQTTDARAASARPTYIVGMVRLVKQKEGWAGLHRGLWPYLASNMLIPAVSGAIMRASIASTPGTYEEVLGRAALRLSLISLATTVLTLPFTVFANRAVIHPSGPLPSHPLKAARVILTGYERSSPLTIYKAPGLLASVFLKSVWSTVVVNGLKALVAVQLLETQREGGGLWVVGFALFQAASTLILTPLQTLIVRLSIQRQDGSPALPTSTQEKIVDPAAAVTSEVTPLRSDDRPYTGLYNAYRTIREEEGGQKLYAGWGMTLFSALLETFV